ncbi:hypothetical protein ACFX13_032616 [Malus domestica]
MEFSKTHLFVACLLFLFSSCFGDQGSPNKQSTKFAEQHRLLRYLIKRQVLRGPDSTHGVVQPPPAEVLDDPAKYDLMRLVPSGPNHEESPEEPPSKVYTPPPPSSGANYDLMRLVPSGPNHEESPEDSPSLASATEANIHRKPHSRRLLNS